MRKGVFAIIKKIDYYNYNLNVRNNNEEEIEKLNVESIKMKTIEYLQMGLNLLKVENDLSSWDSRVYLKCGKQVVVLSCNESYPNKVNETILEVEDLNFMLDNLKEEV